MYVCSLEQLFYCDAAPTGDKTLTPNDVANVLEELLLAQNQSYTLSLKLGLPLAIVEDIYMAHMNPRDRLLHIIITFLKGVKPRPTWRVIVNALRSPAVNLPALAKRVEAAHFPYPTSTRDVVPETTTGMTSLNYDWSNSVSLSFQLQSLWPALPLTHLVKWSSPRHHLN